MKNFVIAIALILSVIAQLSCTQKHDKLVILKNKEIELRFDDKMYCELFLAGLSINIADPEAKNSFPTHFIKIGDSVVRDFQLIKDSTSISDIRNEFGTGRQLKMIGIAKLTDGSIIRKLMVVELYDKYPFTPILWAEYQNLSDKNIVIGESYSNYLRLDASKANEKDFHLFMGAAGRPSSQVYTAIPDSLSRENYMGRTEKFENVKEGFGGVPITDVWCKKMGTGIACIEPLWQNLAMPVRVDADKKTVICILENPGLNLTEPYVLKPNATFKTVKAFINLHELDFYASANVYSQMMQDQNISFATNYTSTDYAASWCSWNDFATASMASKHDVMSKKAVLQRADELDTALYKQIIFDAGWFNNQGDWLPNTDTKAFPGGEKELIETIQSIHQKGFKVMLWITYLTADPWSEVAKNHPDWMITKRDGGFFYDRWSGYTMCPSLPEVQEFHKMMAERLAGKYKADGFKVDGMYTCPPCYNPKHKHADPNESSRDFYKVFKSFYDEVKSINPETTVMGCPCGTTNNFAVLPYLSQTIGADPEKPITVRQMSKLYKALKGSTSPYSSDDVDYAADDALRLPTTIGTGGVPQFFYGAALNKSKKSFYNHWLNIYNKEQLSCAEYINLYDMYYDKPETYVFRKTLAGKEILYYSFFADSSSFAGKIELRGLNKNLKYQVINYPENKNLGTISGTNPSLDVNFNNYLLIKCVPE